jgi:hypothetical protein
MPSGARVGAGMAARNAADSLIFGPARLRHGPLPPAQHAASSDLSLGGCNPFGIAFQAAHPPAWTGGRLGIEIALVASPRYGATP